MPAERIRRGKNGASRGKAIKLEEFRQVHLVFLGYYVGRVPFQDLILLCVNLFGCGQIF